ncbi:MAG TPA: LysM domain-containing protein [Anaerolineaceae bacterium]|nr:LysM domain-containing protein [Anaerolineaceae bacterium]
MKIKAWIFITPLLATFLWLTLPLPAAAVAPPPQVTYQTPTPDLDGRIYYDVQPGDTCTQIHLLTGVDIEELRKLNNLDPACTIITSRLLLRIVELNPTNTPGPTPTNTPVLPSPTPFNGTAQICISLFDDVNGDGQRQDSETGLANGAVSITDRIGKFSQTGSTSGSVDEPLCFKDVPEGDFNISLAVPDGYNPTTILNYALTVKAGDASAIDFGAQSNSAAATPSPSEGGRNPILGLAGGLLLLAGGALGVYFVRAKRTS